MKLFDLRSFSGLIVASAFMLPTASVAARQDGAWREVFQSSPASYEPIPPEVEKRIVEKFKLPPQLMEQMRSNEASGTMRVRFAVSGGGTQLRIRISNEEGTAPLTLSAASVGLAGDGLNARVGTLRAVTFGGKRSVTIPARAPMLSDPIDIAPTAGTELVASAYFAGPVSVYPQGGGLVAVAAGEQTMREELRGATQLRGRPFVSGAEVLARRAPHVIVALGDSITDGNRPKSGELRGWPEELSRRLAARKTGYPYAVLNAGIGGNRVLTSSSGLSALARLDRDVLRVEGVTHVIILEGVNDIGMSGMSFFGENPVISADELIAGYRQIIARIHARGIKVIIGTITPFGGSFAYDTPDKEQMRQAVNRWIRTSQEADAIIDFDQVARDPAKPTAMRKAFGSSDNLHPGEAGYKAMGDAIDLSLFD